MDKLKIAILGVGSIGEFHAREFRDAGCEVVAILTNSAKSSEEKSKKLKEYYNINAKPYYNLEKLLKEEKIDAVSICTPPEVHSKQIKKCLEHNLHVLCEKPFVQDSEYKNYKVAKKLFKLAKEKRKVLSVNTQFVSILESIPKNFDLSKVYSFSIYMEPNVEGVINLISAAAPHMNSLLIRLIGNKNIKNVKFPIAHKDNTQIQFNYGNCQVEYNFGIKEEKPRKFKFSINGTEFERKIGKNYQQQLSYNGNYLNIEDPLKISIKRFVDSIKNKNIPLVKEAEILQNIKLQDLIIKEYLSGI